MEYVNFGSTGVKVSRIALGMGLREQYSDEGAERLVGHAIDSGVNFIDCANRYGLGDDRSTCAAPPSRPSAARSGPAATRSSSRPR